MGRCCLTAWHYFLADRREETLLRKAGVVPSGAQRRQSAVLDCVTIDLDCRNVGREWVAVQAQADSGGSRRHAANARSGAPFVWQCWMLIRAACSHTGEFKVCTQGSLQLHGPQRPSNAGPLPAARAKRRQQAAAGRRYHVGPHQRPQGSCSRLCDQAGIYSWPLERMRGSMTYSAMSPSLAATRQPSAAPAATAGSSSSSKAARAPRAAWQQRAPTPQRRVAAAGEGRSANRTKWASAEVAEGAAAAAVLEPPAAAEQEQQQEQQSASELVRMLNGAAATAACCAACCRACICLHMRPNRPLCNLSLACVQVWAAAEATRPLFYEVDRMVHANLARVQQAMRRHRIGPHHFAGSTGACSCAASTHALCCRPCAPASAAPRLRAASRPLAGTPTAPKCPTSAPHHPHCFQPPQATATAIWGARRWTRWWLR